MKYKNINIYQKNATVLIAPLDWGLGHATRCIPIIYELINLNINVIIAADGKVKILLENEFPNLTVINFSGYNIKYSNKKFWLPIKLFLQTPKLLLAIFNEYHLLKKIIEKEKISCVISDNRLGVFNKNVPSIYITHQLKIKSKYFFVEKYLQKIHYFFINKYNACWVPDNELSNNLSGVLSHPKHLPKTSLSYIGPLSRFEKISTDIKYDILIMISGPEPQRTIFEKLILKELKLFTGVALLIRGLPDVEALPSFENEKIKVYNHLKTQELNLAIEQANIVIGRSGYTTIMDLIKLQKKAILIPTPGQTEQEYLAKYLMTKKIFLSFTQNKFNLVDALKAASVFNFLNIDVEQENYKAAIKSTFT